MSMGSMTCRLPGGYMDDAGDVHQEADISPLSGREEELLAGSGRKESASLVTTILSCCVQRIGNIHPVSNEIVRGLLIADRQYLLLKLREATFGDRVQATIQCPWRDCSQKVDIDFSTGDIPVTSSKDKGPVYTMELSLEAAVIAEDGNHYRNLEFRLPNGGDQEVVSPVMHDNEAKALTLLLTRCIRSIGPFDPTVELIRRLSPLARMEIEKEMEAVAPQVELTMGATCPECQRGFQTPFMLQDFFFGELRTSRELLYREVHYLAYNYHWSEREILEMPQDKRRKYIEILADEMERMNDGVG